MKTRNVCIALAVGALVALAACDASPTAPGATTGSLTVSGHTSISAPGGTTQLTATVGYADGTTRDVTNDARWESSNNDPFTAVVSVISPGLIRAERYGEDHVRATYGAGRQASATTELRVAPEGAHLVTVGVSDGQWAVEGAQVQVTSSAGTFSVTTSLWGVVDLPATGETILQIEKTGFLTFTTSLTVRDDQSTTCVLQRSDVARLDRDATR